MRTIRTTDVWAIPTIENDSNNRCLSRPNNWKLFEQPMFTPSQRLKAIRTACVGAVPTIESYSDNLCGSCPNDWKLFGQPVWELPQRLKAIRTTCVEAAPTIKSYSDGLCGSCPNDWKPSTTAMIIASIPYSVFRIPYLNYSYYFCAVL